MILCLKQGHWRLLCDKKRIVRIIKIRTHSYQQFSFTELSDNRGRIYKIQRAVILLVNISDNGVIQLNQQILDFLNLKIGMKLLSIRSSDIAFTMGATDPLLERADNYEGEIEIY